VGVAHSYKRKRPQTIEMKRKTQSLRERLLSGLVIPAHPLALTAARTLDERRQTALTRYYCAAGAGGVAVGVHTTQFQIRDPGVGLLQPVLELAAAALREHEAAGGAPLVRVAGVCGDTAQAAAEASLARELGYDVGLLSLAALRDATLDGLVAHCAHVAEELPLFGFYLQPAVGGRVLDYAFWRRFLEIEAVVGIKVAPFDRYRTVEVARALADSGRAGDVALYTGNDDSIVADLLADYDFGGRRVRFAGGLLGQWATWTARAVEVLDATKRSRATAGSETRELITLGQQLTDANAALFDARNAYHGCIAGIHEALRRQGLLAGIWCLDPEEGLSAGQAEEIDRVFATYPQLRDDAFVAANLDTWLR
jgi:dihydrodipicolinate synthase/N-acetylneuraminate lyase